MGGSQARQAAAGKRLPVSDPLLAADVEPLAETGWSGSSVTPPTLADDGDMYPRPGLVELVQDEAPALFAFLLDAGFMGPERISDGIAYHRTRLHIEIGHSGGHEPVMGTVVVRGERHELLEDLYVAAGCGPAQDVPSNAHSAALARKRLRQHAAALSRLLPALLAGEAVGGGG